MIALYSEIISRKYSTPEEAVWVAAREYDGLAASVVALDLGGNITDVIWYSERLTVNCFASDGTFIVGYGMTNLEAVWNSACQWNEDPSRRGPAIELLRDGNGRELQLVESLRAAG